MLGPCVIVNRGLPARAMAEIREENFSNPARIYRASFVNPKNSSATSFPSYRVMERGGTAPFVGISETAIYSPLSRV